MKWEKQLLDRQQFAYNNRFLVILNEEYLRYDFFQPWISSQKDLMEQNNAENQLNKYVMSI